MSSWRLARTVSLDGALGVVSGTALDVVVARRLQLGDPDGHVRRALSACPLRGAAQRVRDAYFIQGGKPVRTPFRRTPALSCPLSPSGTELIVVANFVEVWLATEGHAGLVGINYLEKIQRPTLPSLFGAMLAGVDVVLMGAGIPLAIPGILDRLAQWDPVTLPLHVVDDHGGPSTSSTAVQTFDPRALSDLSGGATRRPPLARPRFLAIVSSETVARTMLRRAAGEVDGFVVEGHHAGGHNAPPRRARAGGAASEGTYGPKDRADLAVMQRLGRPFWLAGAQMSRTSLERAKEAGARGDQIGTAVAFCEESGLREDLKQRVLSASALGRLSVRTDLRASPTSYPFKLIELPGTTACSRTVGERRRVCDLGFLTETYRDASGTIGVRCPGEPVAAFTAKGGDAARTKGKQCLCNGLLAAVGLGQVRGGRAEPPTLTAGDELAFLDDVLGPDSTTYDAHDVLCYLRGSARG